MAAAILLSCPIEDFVTRPGIIRSHISAEAFSPNGDGRADVVTVTAELTRPADWKVLVADAGAAVIKEYAGRGQAIRAVWDGRDSFGAVAPEGKYRLLITAIDLEYATQARSVVRETVLDISPPVLSIQIPVDGGEVQGYQNVIGNVEDALLSSYRLSIGSGANPAAFQEVGSGKRPIS
ncbi:MAG TPA: hypothetical protein DDZ65_08625, partial [Firmicutes bacterium]|nr:hypothetical protein [Bacillota bacterium]